MFSSIKTWRWRPTCNRQHLAGLPLCINCGAFVATYRRPSSNPSFLPLSSAAWIIATVSWSTCLSSISSVFSQSKMPQQGSSSTWDVATTSLMRSIGSACQSELHSRWRCWRIVHSTALHHHRPTWRRHSHVSPTCCTDAGSGPPPLIGLTFQLAVVNSWRSCFSCCCCKAVEPPAKRCDISFVAGGVQEQAEDVLVPPLLWNCLKLLWNSSPSNFIPSRTVVLAIVSTI